MRRLVWSQLRFGGIRPVALLVGMLLATMGFTVLTAASSTSQLRTVGTIAAHFDPAYEILVRPHGSRTPLEQQTGTVQPDFLSGIYGGITLAQYHDIAGIAGVDVAAPVAMVGYALLLDTLSTPLPATAYAANHRQLYRVSTTWVSAGGSSRVAQPPSYVYVTTRKLGYDEKTGTSTETASDGRAVDVCGTGLRPGRGDPFGIARQASTTCVSKVNGAPFDGGGVAPGNPGYSTDWVFPMLIAAVDPQAEARLDGLDGALTSGSYLGESAGPTSDGRMVTSFPVLASSAPGIDEYAETQVEQLATPSDPPSLSTAWMTSHRTSPGTVITTSRTTASQAYAALLASLAPSQKLSVPVNAYWSAGLETYTEKDGTLSPTPVSNPDSVWADGGLGLVAMDNSDTQYRALTLHGHPGQTFEDGVTFASPKLVGTFDPTKVTGFDPLSQVPLGIYQPTAATPADPATQKVLGGDLQPSLNLGGYVGQPANLITTLSALPALYETGMYGDNAAAAAPISVIRVRVSGVAGADDRSLERIREVAQRIEQQTGLDVDIVAGSSPTATAVSLPASKLGTPALHLEEGWVKKGVAVTVLRALDRKSLALFLLILVVCCLFVANSAAAAVRSRRRELGVLACLGWTRQRLFASVVAELAGIGLVAGVLGGLLALPVARLTGLHASPTRAALTIPVAMAVAVVAGLVPAWLASRGAPIESVRPPVVAVGRAHHVRGVGGLAATNVLRTPGRALLGVVCLAVGVAALTVTSALALAFHGVVVGSLLGDAVAVQVRGVDYVAAVATVALGILAVADIVFLNIRERAGELATIRALGWPESSLVRLVVTEGSLVGLTGSVLGALVGVLAAVAFVGQQTPALYAIAALAVVVGTLATSASTLLPARALRRLPTAPLLAEE